MNELCDVCGLPAHPCMGIERVVAAMFNGMAAALEWITRVRKED